MRRFNLPLWLKLFLFAITILAPTVLVLVSSLTTSLSFLAELTINSEIEEALRTNIESIHKLRELVPATELTELEAKFNRDLSVYQAYSQMKDLKANLLNELRRHASIVGFVALLVSLIFALGLARNILRLFKRYAKQLLDREHQQVLVSSLENWQTVSQSVIHELKSSLTPLKLISSRRKDPQASLPSESAEISMIVRSEVRKMELLIDELTNFARLPRPQLSATDLNPTLDYFIHNTVIDGLTVQMNLAGLQSKDLVAHDPAMIQRLLYNLMRNSKEANPECDDLCFSINAKANNHSIEFHIRDNGKGIPAHKLNAIFEARHSHKPATSNTSNVQPRLPTNLGIGLTISKKIALDHGGDLYGLPSDSGAHFILVLPLKNFETTSYQEFKYV